MTNLSFPVSYDSTAAFCEDHLNDYKSLIQEAKSFREFADHDMFWDPMNDKQYKEIERWIINMTDSELRILIKENIGSTGTRYLFYKLSLAELIDRAQKKELHIQKRIKQYVQLK